MEDRPRGRTFTAAAAAVVAVVAIACVPPPPTDRAALQAEADAPCGASHNSCVFPFPSEAWQTPDATVATGVRVVPPPSLIDPRLTAQLGPGARIEDAFADNDGFSPMTPIYFQFPTGIDPASVPAGGGDVIAVYDATTRRRVPIRPEVSALQADDRNQRGILAIWPVTRWTPGHQMVALVGPGLTSANGVALPTLRRVPGGLDPAVARLVDARLQFFAATVAPSRPAESWTAATAFTVRSQDRATAQADVMAALTRADQHPVRGVTTQFSLIPNTRIVNGQVRVTDFRDDDWVIPTRGVPASRPRWVDFLMVVPTTGVAPSGAPVAIYGHGITVTKETMITVAASNAAAGIATIGIDVPNHGSRVAEGGFLLDLAGPRTLGRVSSMLMQGALDHVSLAEAVAAHPPALDVAGRLDTERILYEGTSMGGFVGATFLGLTDKVDGAFLQVTGAGVIDTISHSLLWPAFRGTIPVGADTGQAHVLLAGAQTLMDRTDNTFYLERIRRRAIPIYLVYSLDDGVVINASSERLIAMLGLPMVGASTRPPPPSISARSLAAMPADATGAQQVPTAYLDQSFLKPLTSHIAFLDPAPEAALDRWLELMAAR